VKAEESRFEMSFQQSRKLSIRLKVTPSFLAASGAETLRR
jgi:hypothetical protein